MKEEAQRLKIKTSLVAGALVALVFLQPRRLAAHKRSQLADSLWHRESVLGQLSCILVF